MGAPLFRCLPRGLALTEEGEALLPVLTDAFRRIAGTLERFQGGRLREVLTLGAVGTFATGWLLPRLPDFRAAHPFVDLRLMTNNNRIDLAGEGLDCAIRFGDGAWHGTEATRLFAAPLCAPAVAGRLRRPADLARETLLRSYRADEMGALGRRGGAGRAAGPRLRLRLLPGHGGGGGAGRGGSPAAGADVRARAAPGPLGAALRRRGHAGRLLADPLIDPAWLVLNQAA